MAAQGGSGKTTRTRGGPATLRARLQQAEQCLREVEERYALATSAALEGIYEWDLEAERLLLTDRAKDFFALAGDEHHTTSPPANSDNSRRIVLGPCYRD